MAKTFVLFAFLSGFSTSLALAYLSNVARRFLEPFFSFGFTWIDDRVPEGSSRVLVLLTPDESGRSDYRDLPIEMNWLL